MAVEKDDTLQQAECPQAIGRATYPVCFKDDTNLENGFVEVKFKSSRQEIRRRVVWRLKDANNYYVARERARRQRHDLRHVNGRRTERKRAKMKVAPTSGTRCASTFRQSLHRDLRRQEAWNGRHDFKDAGKVGVWTKGLGHRVRRLFVLWKLTRGDARKGEGLE